MCTLTFACQQFFKWLLPSETFLQGWTKKRIKNSIIQGTKHTAPANMESTLRQVLTCFAPFCKQKNSSLVFAKCFPALLLTPWPCHGNKSFSLDAVKKNTQNSIQTNSSLRKKKKKKNLLSIYRRKQPIINALPPPTVRISHTHQTHTYTHTGQPSTTSNGSSVCTKASGTFPDSR